MKHIESDPATPDLSIPIDKVGFIIIKAREYDVKEGDSDPDEGSNPTDDGNADVLEDQADDPVREELVAAIRGLDEDARAELVALGLAGPWHLRSGRMGGRPCHRSQRTQEARRRISLGLPLLGDYLEDGLAMFDEGIVDQEDETEGVDSEDEPLGNTPDKPARQ